MNVCVGRMVISSNRLLISELMFGKFEPLGERFQMCKEDGGLIKVWQAGGVCITSIKTIGILQLPVDAFFDGQPCGPS